MQYEFPHFRIDRSNWLKGGDSYDHYPDGEVRYSSSGYNSFSKPGWFANAPDYGNNLDFTLPTGIGISWARGKQNISQNVLVVGNNSNQDGYFYLLDPGSPSTMAQVGTADTSQDYQLGRTDTVFYKSHFYTTSAVDITLNSADLTVRDTTWWVGTNSKTSLDSRAPHPMVVFGDILYIADARYLHLNDNGAIQTQALDLGEDWVITALVAYNNLIYIAAEPYFNFFGTASGGAKIFTWDGFSDSFLDEYDVNLRINAMYVFKNILYLWNNKAINYFTGTAIKPLYPVQNQIQKSMITSTSDSMLFADGLIVVRYGSPYLTGTFRFHREFAFSNSVNGVLITNTQVVNFFTVSSTSGAHYVLSDMNGPGGGNNTFILNTREFPRPVKIRGYVIHTTRMSTGYVELGFYNDKENSLAVGVKRFTSIDSIMSTRSNWRFDVNNVPQTSEFTPILTIAGSVYIKAIDILYEPSESKQNN